VIPKVHAGCSGLASVYFLIHVGCSGPASVYFLKMEFLEEFFSSFWQRRDMIWPDAR
jgi:hypothetical protein